MPGIRPRMSLPDRFAVLGGSMRCPRLIVLGLPFLFLSLPLLAFVNPVSAGVPKIVFAEDFTSNY